MQEYRCEIFVSFHSGDIDVERASTVGPGVLKRFLRYGETGQLDMPEPTGLGADSPFEEAVASAITGMGYEVEVPLNGLSKLVGSIVDFEGPIHTNEVARRFANAWGKNKVGRRILSHTENALKQCTLSGEIDRLGDFWDKSDRLYTPQIRSRLDASVTLKKAVMLPPTEIKALSDRLIEHNGEMPLEDLVPTIAKAFGFLRTGSDLKDVILKAIGQ